MLSPEYDPAKTLADTNLRCRSSISVKRSNTRWLDHHSSNSSDLVKDGGRQPRVAEADGIPFILPPIKRGNWQLTGLRQSSRANERAVSGKGSAASSALIKKDCVRCDT